jgi:O-antigen ligase
MIGVLIWLLGVRLPPGQRLGRLLLWCWNPALLLVFVVDAHNDALMLLWLALGYYLWQRGHPLTGFLVMCLAPLTKPIGALPLPVLLLGILHGLPDNGRRLRFLVAAAAGGILLAALAFLPFGSPFVLIQRLLREASLHGGFSPVTLVILLTQTAGAPFSYTYLVTGGTLLFAGVFVWLLWLTWRGRSAARSAADTLFGYVATAFTFRIWYSAWPFPWLLVDDGAPSWRLHAGLWFLLCAQLSVIIYGHLRHNLLGGSQLIAHLIGVSFVFLLPLILGRYSARRKLFAIS